MPPSKKLKVEPLLLETYFAVIKGSVGSNAFRHSYALVDGKKQDILRDGELSCAFFASSILKTFDLVEEIHATVSGTILDLEKSGWRKSLEPEMGAIIIWEAVANERGESHAHIGFYIGDDLAVSNDSEKRAPQIHDYKMNGRKITAVYSHQKLKF